MILGLPKLVRSRMSFDSGAAKFLIVRDKSWKSGGPRRSPHKNMCSYREMNRDLNRDIHKPSADYAIFGVEGERTFTSRLDLFKIKKFQV